MLILIQAPAAGYCCCAVLVVFFFLVVLVVGAVGVVRAPACTQYALPR
jgi:hypothetical protein